MESSLSVSVREQENLKELFRILDENGLSEEKKQVLKLADYIESMDEQFGKVLSELQEVKQQMEQIQEKGLRQSALMAVKAVETKVWKAKAQLQVLKEQFLGSVNRAFLSFKEKGTLAVVQSIDLLGIRKGLESVKEQLHQSVENTDQKIQRLSNIGDEIHGVKNHLGNIKRELAGKEPLKASSRDVDKGMVFQIQKMLYGTMGMLSGMEKQTGQTIQKLDFLGQRAAEIRKPSVKENLRSLQEGRRSDIRGRLPVKKKEAMR